MKSILIIVIFSAIFFIKSTDCKTSLSEKAIITNKRLQPEAKKVTLRNLMRTFPVDQADAIAPIISKQSWFGGKDEENPYSLDNMGKFWWKKIVDWLENEKKG